MNAFDSMRSQSFEMADDKGIAAAAAGEFRRALRLIEEIGDAEYVSAVAGQGSIGAHIRHNIDHANCLLAGIANRRIDYSARRRDAFIEVDRDLARIELHRLIDQLSAIPVSLENAFVSVQTEAGGVWTVSSIGRELEFVRSHTVHHHALIRLHLRAMGIATESDFGVAPSTLRFREQEAARRPE